MNHFAVHQKLTQHCKSTILQLKKTFKPLHSLFQLPFIICLRLDHKDTI